MIAFEPDKLLEFFSKTTDSAFMQLSVDYEAVDPIRHQVWNILDMIDEEALDMLTHTGAVTIIYDTIEEAGAAYLKILARMRILPDIGLALIVTYKGDKCMHLLQENGTFVYIGDVPVPHLQAAA